MPVFGTSKPTRTIVSKVIQLLKKKYGLPRHGNPRKPLDDLFYVILSNKTAPETARRTYQTLRKSFPSWDQIRDSEYSRLKTILEPSGLSNIRARHMLGIADMLRSRFGSVSLVPLKKMPNAECEGFLTSLPGVSLKVAKCVMMYTLGHQVLPVDSHVHRVSRRLGWTQRKRADQCHEELESLVDPPLRYAFHVSCIAHGRKICRPANPLCTECVIRRHCDYYQQKQKNAG